MGACLSTLNLEDLLSLGYSGYARVGNYYFRLTGGQVTEDDNLILPESSFASESQLANGQVPSIRRRFLKFSLSFEMTPSAALFIYDAFISWRTLYNQSAPSFSADLVVARGEGYTTQEAYVDSISISNQEGSLTTGQISLTSFVWSYRNGIEQADHARLGSIPFNPRAEEQRPMPHWSSCAKIQLFDAVCINWNLDLNNNWQYKYLLEGANTPPNPRLIYPGPLDTMLKVTMLAKLNKRPPESSPATVTLRIPRPSGIQQVAQIEYPLMIRHPNQVYNGWGSANTPIKWETSYYSLGLIPNWS